MSTSKKRASPASAPGSPPTSRPLNEKQARFCEEYMRDLNASEAARRAGYSEKTAGQQAHDLLKKPEIQQRITELKAGRSERVKLTADYVLVNLQEIVERCMTRAPVMVREGRDMVQATDADGAHVWEFNAKGALTALDLIGKHLGLWKGEQPDAGPKRLEITRRIIHGGARADADAEGQGGGKSAA